MAMKKKFLGVALSAAMVLSASSVYAANETITGNSNSTLNQDVTITGTVSKEDNTSPEGTLTVELPTTLSFSVDKDGVFNGARYQVTNKSSEDITVAVAEFSETDHSENSGIKLQPIMELGAVKDISGENRNNVQLALVGTENRYVDLSDQAQVTAKTPLITVKGNNTTGTIQLLGKAGTTKGGFAESAGAKEDFNLVFEIKKANP